MQVQVTQNAQKELNHLPNKIAIKISLDIQKLANNPFPSSSKKLQFRNNTYRIRIGNYRVVYELDNPNRLIQVVKIRHRKDVYR